MKNSLLSKIVLFALGELAKSTENKIDDEIIRLVKKSLENK